MSNLTIFPPGLPLPLAVYVVNCLSNDVTVFQRPSKGVPQKVRIPLNFNACGLVVDHKRNRVYVTAGDEVDIIDMRTRKVVKTIPVGIQPMYPALNPTGTRLYVPNFRSDTLSVIDTELDKVINEVPVGSQPIHAAVDPSGTHVYVSNSGSFTVSVASTAALELRNKLGRPRIRTIKVARGPIGIAIDQAGTLAYVACQQSNEVDMIDTAQQKVVAHATVGKQPCGIAITPDGSQVWVANADSNSVSILEALTLKPLKTIVVDTPQEIAFWDHFAFVTEGNADRVALLDRTTYKQIAAPTVGDTPQGVAVA